MKQIVLQSGLQGGGYFDSDVENIQLREITFFFDPAVEAAMIGELHNEVLPLFESIKRIDMNDVRVIEGSAGTGFTIEAFNHLFVLGHFAFEQFYCDLALEHRVEGAIHGRHSAGGNDLPKFELPDFEGDNYRMPTFGAGSRFQRRHIARNPVAGFACPANRATQRFAGGLGRVRHERNVDEKGQNRN